MFLSFVNALRAAGISASMKEHLVLLEALDREVIERTPQAFYYLARATFVKDEGLLDRFDQVFAQVFNGIGSGAGNAALPEEWLKAVAEKFLTAEEMAAIRSLGSWDEIMATLKQRLEEQQGRHEGGSKWIGTGGTSPFGHSGAPRQGIRVGGAGGNRSAVKVAGERRYAGYRDDLVLDTRQMQVALRKLRAFAREGGEEELDLEETIAETARNAGELEVVTRPPRRPNTRVILLMDVGGSMDPYAHLVSRLFTAASKATHFKDLRTYYFHNCIYGRVYKSARFIDPVPVADLLADCGPHYKLIFVGDALMGPYELMETGGALGWADPDGLEGIEWLRRLASHFERNVWLNPEPPHGWYAPTIRAIGSVFPMYPLTLDGLGEAVGHLVKGKRRR